MSSGPLVCIVDDDASLRESLGGLLRSAGYQVQAFDSAEAFLADADRARARCLVLDVNMPGMGGRALQLEMIAQEDPLPILFVTALADERLQAEVIERGALACLVKPFDDGALLRLIETATG